MENPWRMDLTEIHKLFRLLSRVFLKQRNPYGAITNTEHVSNELNAVDVTTGDGQTAIQRRNEKVKRFCLLITISDSPAQWFSKNDPLVQNTMVQRIEYGVWPDLKSSVITLRQLPSRFLDVLFFAEKGRRDRLLSLSGSANDNNLFEFTEADVYGMIAGANSRERILSILGLDKNYHHLNFMEPESHGIIADMCRPRLNARLPSWLFGQPTWTRIKTHDPG
ncbi:hypothetical protein GLAREA_13036 [Glarea lozoyensis ATCC 20868]|uniref:Uncharacterized protein n=1 Tax=Glarea lozoyensis (strain ATCC 20868 / MF5171) TaxID=1116229 RepID=S3DVB6_GLAL2|nr:uncharacterized protein GLAREA_13036 [Glarea lozoyensis ATCC 20868]EPE30313.1 hypothetical protein GLAREA_13036 [Glarea lozoyensis ATCC 20868]